MRKDYYKYLVKKLIGIYSSSLLLPLICVLFYIMCMILTNNYSIQFDRFEHIREMTDSLPLYYFVKFVSLVLLGMFFINIGLIFTIIFKNIYLSSIISGFIIIGWSLFGETTLYYYINKIFGSNLDGIGLNVFSMFTTWSNRVSLYESLIYTFLLAFITLGIVSIMLYIKRKILFRNNVKSIILSK